MSGTGGSAPPARKDLKQSITTVGKYQIKRVHVYLSLKYTDPENKDRYFPANMRVVIRFPDDNTTMGGAYLTGHNGHLSFTLPSGKKTFTLDFNSPAAFHYVSSPPGPTDNPEQPSPNEELLIEPNDPHLQDMIFRQKRRMFRLPRVWSLVNSDWASHYSGKFNAPKGVFEKIETDDIGSPGEPVILLLNPHWQYLRFDYYDRFYGDDAPHNKRRVTIPGVMVEGHRNHATAGAPATSQDRADTVSCWTMPPQGEDDRNTRMHCVPWILQKTPGADGTLAGKALPPLNHDMLLRFTTPPATYVYSKSATQRQVQIVDPNNGAAADRAAARTKLKPSVERLKYYDLPAVWQSRGYFTRIDGAQRDFFEHLPNADITNSQIYKHPLTFCLDDIVLTDGAGTPVTLTGDDRVAVFHHLFRNPGAPGGPGGFSTDGVYQARAAIDRTVLPAQPYYFPSSNVRLRGANNNYLADYPDWTRLVIAQGNMFDVFAQRVPFGTGHPVGARAGWRWVQATIAQPGANVTPAGFPSPDHTIVPRPVTTYSSPAPNTQDSYTIIQPFWEHDQDESWQRHRRAPVAPATRWIEWNTPYPDQNANNCGRFDMALFRCCGKDGAKEITVNLHYLRYSFVFHTAGANGSANNTDALQKAYILAALQGVSNRWNRKDPAAPIPNPAPAGGGAPVPPTLAAGSLNPGPARIELMNPNNPNYPPERKFYTDVLLFVQALPQIRSHVRLDIHGQGRSGLAPASGTADFNDPDVNIQNTGWLTLAHETGHARGLNDEYIEPAFACSYWFNGVRCNTPGDPYGMDALAMMTGNAEVRTRHLWHCAEWMRSIYNLFLQVKHGTHTYTLAPHPQNQMAAPLRSYRSYACWPVVTVMGSPVNNIPRFDAYLYPLGDEAFSDTVLRGLCPTNPPNRFDGILSVVVKLRCHFHTNNFAGIQAILNTMDTQLTGLLNFRWAAEFQTGPAAGPIPFKRCLLHFSPRYLVDNFPANPGNPNEAAYLQAVGNIANAGQYATQVTQVQNNHGMHLVFRTGDSLAEAGGARGFTPALNAAAAGQRTLRLTIRRPPVQAVATAVAAVSAAAAGVANATASSVWETTGAAATMAEAINARVHGQPTQATMNNAAGAAVAAVNDVVGAATGAPANRYQAARARAQTYHAGANGAVADAVADALLHAVGVSLAEDTSVLTAVQGVATAMQAAATGGGSVAQSKIDAQRSAEAARDVANAAHQVDLLAGPAAANTSAQNEAAANFAAQYVAAMLQWLNFTGNGTTAAEFVPFAQLGQVGGAVKAKRAWDA